MVSCNFCSLFIVLWGLGIVFSVLCVVYLGFVKSVEAFYSLIWALYCLLGLPPPSPPSPPSGPHGGGGGGGPPAGGPPRALAYTREGVSKPETLLQSLVHILCSKVANGSQLHNNQMVQAQDGKYRYRVLNMQVLKLERKHRTHSLCLCSFHE